MKEVGEGEEDHNQAKEHLQGQEVPMVEDLEGSIQATLASQATKEDQATGDRYDYSPAATNTHSNQLTRFLPSLSTNSHQQSSLFACLEAGGLLKPFPSTPRQTSQESLLRGFLLFSLCALRANATAAMCAWQPAGRKCK